MVLYVKEIKEEACVNRDFISTLVFLKKPLKFCRTEVVRCNRRTQC